MSLFRYAVVQTEAIVVVAVLTSSSVQAGLDDRVPNDANAIIILDVDKIMASPLAQDNNWRAERENAAAAGLTILPASATSFLMAAKLDLESMRPIWELAVTDMNYEPSIPKIAARWHGEVDRISGRNVAELADNSYLIKLGKRKMAAMRPANAQNVAKWLAQTDTTAGHELSPYITEALDYSKHLGTHIVMAIDMEGAVQPERVRKHLAEFESVKDRNVDLDQLAKTLSSIRGITLGLNIKDDISGAIVIDFDQEVSSLKGIAKQVLLEVLANQSATIDEFSDWKEIVEEKRVRVSGRLYRSGLQRILSVLDTPAALHEHTLSPGERPDEQYVAKLASQQYFHSVSGLVDDLKSKPKQTMGQVGMWFQKYARRIDGLPLLNVDAALLDYGSYVSTSFRDAGTTLRNVGGKSRTRQLDEARGSDYGGGTGGADISGFSAGNVYYSGPGSNPAMRAQAQDRTRIRTEERVEGSRSAREIMVDVENATADVRREMTQKYQAEF